MVVWQCDRMKKIKDLFSKMRFQIHPAFLVLFVFCAVFGGLVRLVATSVLALVHEIGHAICAKRYGYRLKKVRLLPFGAELCGDDLFLPYHEIKIAIAGPVVNFAICVLCVASMWIFPSAYVVTNEIFECSLSLGLFNLLPFFPLDGGRVFVGWLSMYMDRKKCLKIAKILTFCFGVVLLVLFIVSLFFSFNLSFGIMAVSLVATSVVPQKNTAYMRVSSKEFKRKKLASGLLKRQIQILSSASVVEALERVDARMFTEFVVVDECFCELERFSEVEVEDFAEIFGTKTTFEKLVFVKKSLTK